MSPAKAKAGERLPYLLGKLKAPRGCWSGSSRQRRSPASRSGRTSVSSRRCSKPRSSPATPPAPARASATPPSRHSRHSRTSTGARSSPRTPGAHRSSRVHVRMGARSGVRRPSVSEREVEELRVAAAAEAGRSRARGDLSLLLDRGLRTRTTVALSRAEACELLRSGGFRTDMALLQEALREALEDAPA
jgi:hypothetical protein